MTGAPPPSAPDRVAAMSRKEPDSVSGLPERLHGTYDERLCTAIVAALRVERADRPQSVDQWREIARVSRRKFSQDRSPGKAKPPPAADVAKPPGSTSAPPLVQKPPPGASAKAEDAKKKSPPPKVEREVKPPKEANPEPRPKRFMLTVIGISIALGLLIALGGLVGQPGAAPVFFTVVVLGLVMGGAFLLTWRGNQMAHVTLVVLTLILLGFGVLYLVLIAASSGRTSDTTVAIAVGALVVGWTGVPLLTVLLRRVKTQGEAVRTAAK